MITKKRLLLLYALILSAFIVHAGTAILRLNSFFPITKITDFTSYYISAWLFHHGHSPYPLPVKFAESFSKVWGLSYVPSSTPSTPLWLLFIEPFTFLSLPLAACAWFVLNCMFLVCCHKILLKMAGYGGLKQFLMTLPFTITFGPLFLNLTIGQCCMIMLMGSLLILSSIREEKAYLHSVSAVAVFVASVSAKLYPMLWIYGLLIGRSFKKSFVMMASVFSSFFIFFVFDHQMILNYVFHFMPNQARLYSQRMNLIDDQSVYGYVRRILSHGSSEFPGRVVSHMHQLHWSWPWELSASFIMLISAAVIFLIYIITTLKVYKSAGMNKEQVFIVGVLLSTIVLPHMARYNGIMALPALAWLWGTGCLSLRYMAAMAYFLFALSRLTHLWALILPGKLAIIMSGAGLVAVLLLVYAMLSKTATRSPPHGIQTDG